MVAVSRIGVVELDRDAARRLLKLLNVEAPDPTQPIKPVTLPLFASEPGGGEGVYATVSGEALVVRCGGSALRFKLGSDFTGWYNRVGPWDAGEVLVWPLPDAAKLYFKLTRVVEPAKPEPAASLFAIITPEEGGLAVKPLKASYLGFRREVYTPAKLKRPEAAGELAPLLKVEVASPIKLLALLAAKRIKDLARSQSLKPHAIIVDEPGEGYNPKDVAEALLWEGVYSEVREPPHTCFSCGGLLIEEGEVLKCASCGFGTYRAHLILYDAVRHLPPLQLIPPPEPPPIKTLKAAREFRVQLPEPLEPQTIPLLPSGPGGEPPYAYIESGALHIVLRGKSLTVPLPADAVELVEPPPVSWGILATPARVITTDSWATVIWLREWCVERPNPNECMLAVFDVHPNLLVAHYYDTARRKRLKRWAYHVGDEPPEIEKLASGNPIVTRALRQAGGSWQKDRYSTAALAAVLKLVSYAVTRNLTPYAIIDAPRGVTQGFLEGLRDWLEWYGVWYEERRLLTSICPICHRELKGGGTRRCECGFEAEEHTVPLYWALRQLGLPLQLE